ncbi:rna-directed dna polymerase from mobile element jockey [Lasius niger]|uniref:Rna-directed dna polymerase from mobile element jockey n=1 Tax=Lasius niger TaxID=67767 RepID=A0A0J7KHU8_LASNI|nr:rna-directed dna polymerase from mobile element jockey [Lasius niger]
MVCLFLDICGAFDNVISNILIEDLIKIGLPPKICWFVYQLTYFRDAQLVINGTLSLSLVSNREVPQGSILSPLLFNIYAKEFKRQLSKNCQIIQFADDITLFMRSDDLKASLKTIENSANNLAKFLLSPPPNPNLP